MREGSRKSKEIFNVVSGELQGQFLRIRVSTPPRRKKESEMQGDKKKKSAACFSKFALATSNTPYSI